MYKMTTALLSSTYFGPVQWYQKLNRYDRVLIEQYDSFIKQTYRNRCVIATTQGTQSLTIPIERDNGSIQASATRMKDIRISNHGKWRSEHWNALRSAYGDSPFFDYYADDLHPFFERHWDFLFDFNLDITQKMCELLDINPNIELTDTFIATAAVPSSSDVTTTTTAEALSSSLVSPSSVAHSVAGTSFADYREAIRPKHPLPDPTFEPRSYYQVYQQKHGFLPNLSILDLLFNMGNESILYL